MGKRPRRASGTRGPHLAPTSARRRGAEDGKSLALALAQHPSFHAFSLSLTPATRHGRRQSKSGDGSPSKRDGGGLKDEKDEDRPVFPLAQLRRSTSDEATAFPDGVDATRREKHLSREDFEEALGMAPSAFSVLPQWRQKALKRAAGLF